MDYLLFLCLYLKSRIIKLNFFFEKSSKLHKMGYLYLWEFYYNFIYDKINRFIMIFIFEKIVIKKWQKLLITMLRIIHAFNKYTKFFY